MKVELKMMKRRVEMKKKRSLDVMSWLPLSCFDSDKVLGATCGDTVHVTVESTVGMNMRN